MTTSVNEKDYTDKDALKDHKRLITKAKQRLKDLKADLHNDGIFLKDKEDKIKTASDEKSKHAGVPTQKQMYANNIKKIKDRMKETAETIKEVEAEIKDRMKKHAEAVADVNKKNEGVTMKPAKELMAVIESLDANGELEELPVGDEPVEVEVEDITDMDEDDDMEDDEEDEMTDDEADAEIEEGLKSITEEEAEAEEEPSDDEDDMLDEAKSTFPKAKQILKLKAMKRKEQSKKKAADMMVIDARNARRRAADKDEYTRSDRVQRTKEIKKKEAVSLKHAKLIARIANQIQRLEDERKAFNKKRKPAVKKAPADKK